MRGGDTQQGGMWSYIQPERRVPQDHPLRPIRAMVDQALRDLSPRFALLYSHTGRPSIPPEQLLRALLLQAFYSVRSERQLMEQLDYNLLFRWFVGLSLDDPIWDPTVFTKNRDRLFQGDIAQAFFAAVLSQARQADLVSAEHFTVDGTLLENGARIIERASIVGRKTNRFLGFSRTFIGYSFTHSATHATPHQLCGYSPYAMPISAAIVRPIQ